MVRTRRARHVWSPDGIYLGDARVSRIPDECVDLVVTSPPYNTGKEYEREESLSDWRGLIYHCLHDWWRVLKPGGRLCMNLANTYRRPYLSLVFEFHKLVENLNRRARRVAEVVNGPGVMGGMRWRREGAMFYCGGEPDRVPFLANGALVSFALRGEILWDKGASVGVSTAWGSYGAPGNPTLRDLHEYILVYVKPAHPDLSKGKAYGIPIPEYMRGVRPIVDHLPEEERSRRFADLTRSIWAFPTASAKKLGHPTPFPVELPRRCIELYVWPGGLVYDPFMGSGTTAVATVELNGERPMYPPVRWVGCDNQASYVQLARERVAAISSA